MKCRECGCTDEKACPGGCAWAEPQLCTRCVPVHGLRTLRQVWRARATKLRNRAAEGPAGRAGPARELAAAFDECADRAGELLEKTVRARDEERAQAAAAEWSDL